MESHSIDDSSGEFGLCAGLQFELDHWNEPKHIHTMTLTHTLVGIGDTQVKQQTDQNISNNHTPYTREYNPQGEIDSLVVWSPSETLNTITSNSHMNQQMVPDPTESTEHHIQPYSQIIPSMLGERPKEVQLIDSIPVATIDDNWQFPPDRSIRSSDHPIDTIWYGLDRIQQKRRTLDEEDDGRREDETHTIPLTTNDSHQSHHLDRLRHLIQLANTNEFDDDTNSVTGETYSQVASVDATSTAFPHQPLESVSDRLTFTQAMWDHRSIHLMIGDHTHAHSHMDSELISPRQIFEMILRSGLSHHALLHSTIDETQLVTEALLMVQGISTPHLRWNSHDRCFHVSPHDLRLVDTSPSALRQTMEPLIQLGSEIKLLFEFVALQSVSGVGVVLTAFTRGVEEILQQYSMAVLRVTRSIHRRRSQDDNSTSLVCQIQPTLLELRVHLHQLAGTIHFISRVCQIPTGIDEPDTFPRGAELLNYLYTLLLGDSCRTTSQVDSPSVVTRRLFVLSLSAYMVMVRDWIYRGAVTDPFEEFIVEWRSHTNPPDSNSSIVPFDDELVDDLSGRVVSIPRRRINIGMPLFLAPLASTIFHAGETVFILRLHQPKRISSRQALTSTEEQIISANRVALEQRNQRRQALQEREAAHQQRQSRRQLQQERYAKDLQDQIAARERDLADLTAKAAEAESIESVRAAESAAVIATERARLLRELDAVRSPHSITGGLNKSLDWRVARDQLSPIRQKKLLEIEAGYVNELSTKLEGGDVEQTNNSETNHQETESSNLSEKFASVDGSIDDHSTTHEADAPIALDHQSSSRADVADLPPITFEPTSSATLDTANSASIHAIPIDHSDTIVFPPDTQAAELVAKPETFSNDADQKEHNRMDLTHYRSSQFMDGDSPDSTPVMDGSSFSSADGESGESQFVSLLSSSDGTPLPLLVESVLLAPLVSHMSHLSQLGLGHFHDVHSLQLHMYVLRDYFFMNAGPMMEAFMNELYESANRSIRLTGDIRMHTEAVRVAFHRASADYQPIHERHLTAVKHCQFAMDPSREIIINDFTTWQAIRMTYSVPYPLDRILQQKSLQQYANVCQFLMRMARVQTYSQRSWKGLHQPVSSHSQGRDGERDGADTTMFMCE